MTPCEARFFAGVDRPFIGLRAFGYEDRRFFFGREEQGARLVELVDRSPFVAVVGSSGSGKSSLVRAGLLPLLVEDDDPDGRPWLWAEMRPGSAPIGRLATAMAAAGGAGAGATATDPFADVRRERIELILRSSSFGIGEALPHVPALGARRLLILVDQFEELFRFADLRAESGRDAGDAAEHRDEATAFVQLLLTAAGDASLPVHVVVTMRSDFIGDCARFHGLPEAVTQSQFLVPGLTRDQRERAIRGPVALASGSIEPLLVQRLLNDTNEELDQLPVLQHVLMRCWQRAAGRSAADGAGGPCLTMQDYAAVGGIGRALSEHADELLRELGRDLEPVVQRVFQALTDVDREGRVIRRPQKLGALAEVAVPEGADVDERARVERQVCAVVERFASPECSFLRARLLPVLELHGAVDIGHEALIRCWDRLKGVGDTDWVRLEQRDGENYRDLLRVASCGDTLSERECERLAAWWDERQPNRFWAHRYTPGGGDRFDEVTALLERSRAEIARVTAQRLAAERDRVRADIEQRSRRRWQSLAAASVALLFATAGAGAYAWESRQAAETQRQLAEKRLAELNTSRAEKANAEWQLKQSRAANFTLRAEEALRREGATTALLLALEDLEGRDGLVYVPRAETLAYAALQDLHESRVLGGHTRMVSAVAFDPVGRLVTTDSEGVVRFWDLKDGRLAERRKLGVQIGFGMVVSPDGQHVLATTMDRRTVVMPTSGAGPDIVIGSPENPAGPGVFSPDNKRILTGGLDSRPRLWTASGELVHVLPDHGTAVFAVAFSPDGTRLATGARDGKIRIFDASSYELLREFQGHEGAVTSLAFSPAQVGGLLLSAGADRKARLWRVADGNLVRDLVGHDGIVFRAAFSPDGRHIATASEDRTIRLWRVGGNGPGTALRGHTSGVMSVAFSPDGELIASGSSDGTARLWHVAAALRPDVTPVEEDAARTGPPEAGALATSAAEPDGRAAPDDAASMPSLPVRRDGRAPVQVTLPARTGPLRATALSPDGGRLVVAPAQGRLLLFDLSTPDEPVAILGRQPEPWAAVAFAPDGKEIVGVEASGRQRAWPYLPDRAALIELARRSLPLVGDQHVELTDQQRCYYWLLPPERCPDLGDDLATASR